MTSKYDCLIVGAGHAGCEAALAAARMGCKTLLITLRKDKIAYMSCNPAIGGVGKGQLVKEIDSLGGEMAKAADSSAIQYRMLNTSRGPAVWSSRAQIDMQKYSKYMQKVIGAQKHLKILEALVTEIIIKDNAAKGIKTDKGKEIFAKTVVIAPGTFLNGLIHMGMKSFDGGRIEEKETSKALSTSLRNIGFNLLRFKTGTCARLDGKTIDFKKLKVQRGDKHPAPFSFSTKRINIKQVPCYITYTTKNTHEIILKNLDRSPLYGGKITGTGVRYCPSLEDKVVKFPHHERHHIFLERQGLNTNEYYPNGLSTSLPEDVQEEFIRSVPGLERVKINRFGYGIEHDVVEPTQAYPTMETKLIRNLYLAGQINGTTGYEEAAAQGLIAGINASLRAKNKAPLILDRSTSYIGVLLDDLTTKGTNEPYRMFTSRVEYRLLLREDNADIRLGKFGFETGLIAKRQYDKIRQKQQQVSEGIKSLKQKNVSYKGEHVNLFKLLRRPGVKINDIKKQAALKYAPSVLNEIEIEVKYSGFIQRQLSQVKSFRHLEKIKIPQILDYNNVGALSREIKEKLTRVKPLNLGQASRISGVTPVAITTLMVHFRKMRNG